MYQLDSNVCVSVSTILAIAVHPWFAFNRKLSGISASEFAGIVNGPGWVVQICVGRFTKQFACLVIVLPRKTRLAVFVCP